jgi:hypothetical protein
MRKFLTGILDRITEPGTLSEYTAAYLVLGLLISEYAWIGVPVCILITFVPTLIGPVFLMRVLLAAAACVSLATGAYIIGVIFTAALMVIIWQRPDPRSVVQVFVSVSHKDTSWGLAPPFLGTGREAPDRVYVHQDGSMLCTWLGDIDPMLLPPSLARLFRGIYLHRYYAVLVPMSDPGTVL